MLRDCMNVWHDDNGLYHIRYAGKHHRFDNYLEAKAYIDSVVQSAWFSGLPVANTNEKGGGYA